MGWKKERDNEAYSLTKWRVMAAKGLFRRIGRLPCESFIRQAEFTTYDEYGTLLQTLSWDLKDINALGHD